MTQWLELPDGQRFFTIVRTVISGGSSHASERIYRAIALACAAEHAPRLVYSEGTGPAEAEPTPIGIACRLCNRAQCRARAVPPIGRGILADDYRRTLQPFEFAEN